MTIISMTEEQRMTRPEPPFPMYTHASSAPPQEFLRSVVEAFCQPEQLLIAFFQASNVGIGVCDTELRYTAVNEALARMNGVPAQAHLGKTVRHILGDAADVVEPILQRVIATGRAVCSSELRVKLPTRTEVGYWTHSYFPIKDAAGRVKQVGAILVEITDRKKLENSFRELTRKLLRAQDEEQRRIARHLHDSMDQYLAGLKMNLSRLRRTGLASGQRSQLLTQSIDLLERCMTETRTISYLLHPPLLEEMGFAAATRWYVRGFAQRSGIKVTLDIPSQLERLPQPVEIAMFRVLQEALTNVHRYAHSSTLDVEIRRTEEDITLQVHDYGCGIPPGKLRDLQKTSGRVGVGIASMHERVRELGGCLQIESSAQGTIVRAEIPLAAAGDSARRQAAAASA